MCVVYVYVSKNNSCCNKHHILNETETQFSQLLFGNFLIIYLKLKLKLLSTSESDSKVFPKILEIRLPLFFF